MSDDRYIREVDDDTLRREKARARDLRQTPWWRRASRQAVATTAARGRRKGADARSRGAARARRSLDPRQHGAACKDCNTKKQSLLVWEWQAYLDTLDPSAES